MLKIEVAASVKEVAVVTGAGDVASAQWSSGRGEIRTRRDFLLSVKSHSGIAPDPFLQPQG